LLEEGVLSIFEACDAVWFHDGNPKSPHAKLASGLCSNGYFNCSKVLKYPEYCHSLAYQLVMKLKTNGMKRVDWVVGPAYGAITLSFEVARIIGAIHAFTEKDPRSPKKMLWSRFQIPKGSRVLQIEDAVATGETLQNVRRVINESNKAKVKFLQIVGTIVHRPVKLPTEYCGIKVVALIEKEIPVFKPQECPLCKAGSPRYRPKAHWKELTKKR